MKVYSLLQKGLMAVLMAAGTVGMQSCLDDDDNTYYVRVPNALVTAKTDTDQTFFLQLDDQTTLLPVNMAASPYEDKEVRALVNFEEVNEESGKYTKAVHVHWIDSILTKPMAANLGTENDEVYGNDPVEIINDWVTIAEDGYLTLRFRTRWGNTTTPHYVNLLSTNNPDNPYEVEFRHNAYGDTNGMEGDALVAFKLDGLPDTEGKTVKLTLKWNSFSGEKSHEFDYCTRKEVNPNPEAITSLRSSFKMK